MKREGRRVNYAPSSCTSGISCPKQAILNVEFVSLARTLLPVAYASLLMLQMFPFRVRVGPEDYGAETLRQINYYMCPRPPSSSVFDSNPRFIYFKIMTFSR